MGLKKAKMLMFKYLKENMNTVKRRMEESKTMELLDASQM